MKEFNENNYYTAIWYKQALARFIDLIVILIISLLFSHFSSNNTDLFLNTAARGMAVQLVGLNSIIDLFALDSSNFENVLNDLIGALTIGVFLTIIEVFSKGRSIGMFMLGLRVVQVKNRQIIHPITTLLRNLLRIIPFSFISYLAKRPKGFHNLICGTEVIDTTYQNGAFSLLGNNFKDFFKGNILTIKNKSKSSNVNNSNLERLDKLFDLKEKGAITEEEFIKYKDEILKD